MTTGEKLLSNSTALASFREAVASLRGPFFETGRAAVVLDGLSVLVDSLVTQSFTELLAPVAPNNLALLAVGGYGRRELFPSSDVDLLFLVDQTPPSRGPLPDALSVFIQRLWDSGLRLSHSVHTVKECVELHEANIEFNVSLLDHRFLTGDPALYTALHEQFPKFLQTHGKNLSRHLCRLSRSRHSNFQDTIYHLEPNIKEGPGGLRDLNLLSWLSKLRSDAPSDSVDPALEPARDFLWTLRTFLHYRAGRDQNVLSFDAQEEIVTQPFLRSPASSTPSVEDWMRSFFRHVRTVNRSTLRVIDNIESKNSGLLAGFLDWRSRLSNSEFSVSRDRVFLKSSTLFQQDPMAVLRLFQFAGRHGIRPSVDAEQRISDRLPQFEEFFRKPQALWPALREVLAQPHAALALRAMHEAGLLCAVFPEWTEIECRVVRDFYHRYTVDEHTLVAIQNLEQLTRTDKPSLKRFASLLAEIEDPAVLRLALLYHDVGKNGEGEGHVAGSVDAAKIMLDRIQAPAAARTMVVNLIAKHLDLSAAMTTRDLTDPATAQYLAEKVGTLEELKYLTMLTWADISAVNPNTMTPWRQEQLWQVYLTTYKELTRELDSSRIGAGVASSPEREEFLKGLPLRYLRTHTEEEVASHLELEKRRRLDEIALEIRKLDGFYRLTVLAKDRIALFSQIAGALASFGLNILKAEAFANQQGTVVDTFLFNDPQRSLELNPSEAERLEHTIERVLLGKAQAKDLLKYRPRTAPPSKNSAIEPRVSFDNEASGHATLVEIVAQDRPGLLYDVAAAFSAANCSIDVVLVDTEAHKAMDVFYVSSGGRKLTPAQLDSLKQTLLAACAAL